MTTLTVGGVEYLLGPETQDTLAGCRGQAEAVFALPHFDELLLGYRDRNPTLPPERDINVFANRNGVPARTILHKGQVIATWTRPRRGSGDTVELTPLVSAPAALMSRAAAKAAEIADLPENGQLTNLPDFRANHLAKLVWDVRNSPEHGV